MAGKAIANPYAVLGLKSRDFTSGLKDAAKSVTGFASSFTSQIAGVLSSAGSLTGIGAVIGGALAGIGVGALASSQMEAIDSTAKLSDRLGVATEQLTGLQHAADLSGVSTEQLSGGMGKMLKTMAEAAGGSKEAAAAFDTLRLDAKELINLPTDQAMGKIADKLNEIENPAQKAAAVMGIFGKTGQELLPFLAEGSQGLAEMTKDASDLGLSFSRVDAAKVEEANDAITRFKDVFKGIANQIAIAISPAIAGIADAATGVGIKVVTMVKNLLPPLMAVLGKAYGVVVSFVSPIFDWLSSNTDAIMTFVADAIATGVTFIGDVFSGLWTLATAVWQGIAAVIDWAITGIASAVQSVLNLFGVEMPSSMQATAGSASIVGGVFSWLAESVSNAIAVIGYVIKNWQALVEIAGLSIALNVVTLGNQIAYVLTEQVPAYLSWFGDNWQNIFTDLFNFTATVFTNMGANVSNFFSALWSFLKGDGFDFKWQGLLDGFESTVSELPKIAERQVGPLEQALSDQLSTAQNDFTNGLLDAVDSKNKLGEEIKKGLADSTKPPPVDNGGAPKPSAFNFDGEDPDLKDKKKKADKVEESKGTAVLSGSAESLALRDTIIKAPQIDTSGVDTPNVDTPFVATDKSDSTDKYDQLMKLLNQYLPYLEDIGNEQDFSFEQVSL